jgi:peptidoglycan/xylan/chitin deacetylase (PgdA/CDA1 family)
VLEIPIGSDGAGARYANILHVEQSDLDNLMRIWDVIVARAEAEGRPQVIHCLFHTGSMGRPELVERYRRFLDLVPKRHGQFVTTREAARLHERFDAEVSA